VRFLILGRGKTGTLVAQVATERGHEVRALASQENQDARGLTPDLLQQMDVVIDFTNPHAVIPNIVRCAEAGVPIVVGTTGWSQHLEKVRELIQERKGSLVYASNFSVGVNLFFKAIRAIAPAMSKGYHASIVEKHHAQKKDKPSGTAATIRKILDPGAEHKVEITSLREGDTVGMHLVALDSVNDTILLTHDAKSRLGFAEGAVRAAEWIKGKSGVYEFTEMIDQL
jgi:4-hydroxy-tetrahydrodipicolinate reductase